MQGLQSVCFQRPSNFVFPEAFKKPLFFFSEALKRLTFLRVQCFTRVVWRPLPVTLSQHLCSLLACQCVHALAPDRAATPTLAFAAISFEIKVNACSKISQTGSHLARDDLKRFNQIKIMQFIQTSLAQSESARPKATALYAYKMTLFLVACLF